MTAVATFSSVEISFGGSAKFSRQISISPCFIIKLFLCFLRFLPYLELEFYNRVLRENAGWKWQMLAEGQSHYSSSQWPRQLGCVKCPAHYTTNIAVCTLQWTIRVGDVICIFGRYIMQAMRRSHICDYKREIVAKNDTPMMCDIEQGINSSMWHTARNLEHGRQQSNVRLLFVLGISLILGHYEIPVQTTCVSHGPISLVRDLTCWTLTCSV